MKVSYLAMAGLLAMPAASETLEPIPEAASRIELRFQPLLDFDMDGCYNTAAISKHGRVNPGRMKSLTTHARCRDKSHLTHSNAYSRKRCNNGFCAIMYEYYFEKDQSMGLSGHRHDWENIVVFTDGDKVVRVAASEEQTRYKHSKNCLQQVRACYIPMKKDHPLLVYHLPHGDLHNFRFAKQEWEAGDGPQEAKIEEAENPFGHFYRSPLVGWDHWPNDEWRDKMVNWHGPIKPSMGDETFGKALEKAAGSFKAVPGFDPYHDDNKRWD